MNWLSQTTKSKDSKKSASTSPSYSPLISPPHLPLPKILLLTLNSTSRSLLLDAVDIAVPAQPTLLHYLSRDPIPAQYHSYTVPFTADSDIYEIRPPPLSRPRYHKSGTAHTNGNGVKRKVWGIVLMSELYHRKANVYCTGCAALIELEKLANKVALFISFFFVLGRYFGRPAYLSGAWWLFIPWRT